MAEKKKKGFTIRWWFDSSDEEKAKEDPAYAETLEEADKIIEQEDLTKEEIQENKKEIMAEAIEKEDNIQEEKKESLLNRWFGSSEESKNPENKIEDEGDVIEKDKTNLNEQAGQIQEANEGKNQDEEAQDKDRLNQNIDEGTYARDGLGKKRTSENEEKQEYEREQVTPHQNIKRAEEINPDETAIKKDRTEEEAQAKKVESEEKGNGWNWSFWGSSKEDKNAEMNEDENLKAQREEKDRDIYPKNQEKPSFEADESAQNKRYKSDKFNEERQFEDRATSDYQRAERERNIERADRDTNIDERMVNKGETGEAYNNYNQRRDREYENVDERTKAKGDHYDDDKYNQPGKVQDREYPDERGGFKESDYNRTREEQFGEGKQKDNFEGRNALNVENGRANQISENDTLRGENDNEARYAKTANGKDENLDRQGRKREENYPEKDSKTAEKRKETEEQKKEKEKKYKTIAIFLGIFNILLLIFFLFYTEIYTDGTVTFNYIALLFLISGIFPFILIVFPCNATVPILSLLSTLFFICVLIYLYIKRIKIEFYQIDFSMMDDSAYRTLEEMTVANNVEKKVDIVKKVLLDMGIDFEDRFDIEDENSIKIIILTYNFNKIKSVVQATFDYEFNKAAEIIKKSIARSKNKRFQSITAGGSIGFGWEIDESRKILKEIGKTYFSRLGRNYRYIIGFFPEDSDFHSIFKHIPRLAT